jgi:hypothetical protein
VQHDRTLAAACLCVVAAQSPAIDNGAGGLDTYDRCRCYRWGVHSLLLSEPARKSMNGRSTVLLVGFLLTSATLLVAAVA